MNEVCREQFIALHSQPILEDCPKVSSKLTPGGSNSGGPGFEVPQRPQVPSSQPSLHFNPHQRKFRLECGQELSLFLQLMLSYIACHFTLNVVDLLLHMRLFTLLEAINSIFSAGHKFYIL